MKWTANALVTIGALLVAAPAMSQPTVQLAWDNCRTGGGAAARSFACDTNAGSHTLVLSVTAPAGIDQWNSFEATLGWHFMGAQPDWWQLRNQTGQTDQCRNGALSANPLGFSVSGCTDVYSGNGAGGIAAYQNGPNIPPAGSPPPGADRARLLMVFAIPSGSEVPLTTDETYFVANVVITNAKTVGDGSCAGCALAACATLHQVRIGQPSGAPGGNVTITDGGPGFPPESVVFWRSAGWSDCGCTDNKNSMSTCAICPPKVATWGAIKSLYR